MAAFTITDTTDPVLSGTTAANDTLTINCDAAIPGFPNIVAADNCGAANVVITVDSVQAQLSCLYNFVRIRTWTGTDDCDNTSSISQVLIVQDTTKPVLACNPEDLAFECAGLPGNEGRANIWNQNNIDALKACVTDNCTPFANVTVESDFDYNNLSDECGLTGEITVTYTITDVCGNGEPKARDPQQEHQGLKISSGLKHQEH